jgi:phosphatidylglycerol:prolipoprotein diacylglycerol transferase
MLPYLGLTTFHVFGIPFQVWGTIVALGYALGTYVAWRRAKQKGLNGDVVLDLAFWIFIAAFVGSRLFHVLAYNPGYYFAHPLEALDPRLPGYAIFGGFLGAALVFVWTVYRKKLAFFEYADVLTWGLPWGCGVGRIGCFLIHDHPGTLTHFILGVRYPDGQVRHDLGLYLSLLGFGTGLLFLWLNRKQRHPGFWLGVYLLVEGVSRICLDFLRVEDARYLGLTPTQYLSLPFIALGIWCISRARPMLKSPS